jgi:hypothetical protein
MHAQVTHYSDVGHVMSRTLRNEALSARFLHVGGREAASMDVLGTHTRDVPADIGVGMTWYLFRYIKVLHRY